MANILFGSRASQLHCIDITTPSYILVGFELECLNNSTGIGISEFFFKTQTPTSGIKMFRLQLHLKLQKPSTTTPNSDVEPNDSFSLAGMW